MADSKATPGPWTVREVGQGGPHDNPVPICEVVSADGRAVVCEYASEADAHLIASAPNLLDTARALHFLCNALCGELDIDVETTEFSFTANGAPLAKFTAGEFMRAADAAIVKATGGAP